MDKTNYCNINASTILKIDITYSALPVISVVSCTLAIFLLVYYKLHQSPTHRLILYMLISQLLNSSSDILQIPFLWLKNDVTEEEAHVPTTCLMVAFLKVYCGWSVALSTAVVTAEIVSMIMCYYELHNEERVFIIIIFFLPIILANIPIITQSFGYSIYSTCAFRLNNCYTTPMQTYEEYGPLSFITCICMVAMVLAIVRLIYNWMHLKLTSTSLGEEYSINQVNRFKYQNALKETLPLAVYPTISLVSLLLYYLHLVAQNELVLDFISVVVKGSTGTICSGAFFIHLHVLRTKRRKRTSPLPRQNYQTFASINEGHRFETAGTITATHVTEFYPKTESEIDNDENS